MSLNEEKLKTAIATGNNLKGEYGYGKEWYALYTGHMPDAILEFISGKIEQMYPELSKETYLSIPGVAFRLLDYREHTYIADGDMLFIHKASFKRNLKKAICRNRNQR